MYATYKMLTFLWLVLTCTALFFGALFYVVMLLVADATGGVDNPVWELLLTGVWVAPLLGPIIIAGFFGVDLNEYPEFSGWFLLAWYGLGLLLLGVFLIRVYLIKK